MWVWKWKDYPGIYNSNMFLRLGVIVSELPTYCYEILKSNPNASDAAYIPLRDE